MDFALTDDQTLIRDAAESFLADVSDSAGVRRAATLPLGYDESVWQRIGAELGWCGVAIPEGLVVGEDPEFDAKWFRRTEEGVTLITQAMVNRYLADR